MPAKRLTILQVLFFLTILLTESQADLFDDGDDDVWNVDWSWTSWGKRHLSNDNESPNSIVQLEKTCLAGANESNFAVVFDLANSTNSERGRSRLGSANFIDFIESVSKDVKNENFFLGIVDGSKIRWLQEPMEPTTTAPTTTKAFTVVIATENVVHNDTTLPQYYRRQWPIWTHRPPRQRTNEPVLPSVLEAALKARSLGVPIGDMVHPPSSFTFAAVVTDGAQHTPPSQLPTGPRLIFDIDGKWVMNTVPNYSGTDVIILDRSDVKDQLETMVKTVRYQMCQQVKGISTPRSSA